MRTRSPSTSFRSVVALAAVLALALAACGPDAAPDEPDDAVDDAPEPADDPADESADEPAGAVTVALGGTDHGEVLVDGAGMTLYVFDPDEQGPSTCYDECADAWPPLVTDDAPDAGDGVDAGLLGTVERDDGSTQVTYDGWPLYFWASDAAPGDATGQGVQDVWWVIESDGSVVRGDGASGGADDAANDDEPSSPAY